MGSSPSWLKFVFLSQPSEVVLLVIESAQSPNFRHPLMMSTQGVMITARCSRRLFDARNRRWGGRYECQAKPLLL
jgi:hypothetical protein